MSPNTKIKGLSLNYASGKILSLYKKNNNNKNKNKNKTT